MKPGMLIKENDRTDRGMVTIEPQSKNVAKGQGFRREMITVRDLLMFLLPLLRVSSKADASLSRAIGSCCGMPTNNPVLNLRN
eukprot:1632975-Rhodomonas_salina.2